jgi:hypothetical protein
MQNIAYKVTEFLSIMQNKLDAHDTEINRRKLMAVEGKRYYKIVQVRLHSAGLPAPLNLQSAGQSVFCFIDKNSGDVLKPASWAAPAKHARGNVFDESSGTRNVGVYGPGYLRECV